jgi:hypothetical protein
MLNSFGSKHVDERLDIFFYSVCLRIMWEQSERAKKQNVENRYNFGSKKPIGEKTFWEVSRFKVALWMKLNLP